MRGGSAACFSRGSERWHRWLRENRRFGPLLRDWEQYRAIRARARLLAIVPLSMAAWITATFLTRPEPRATLRAFYLKKAAKLSKGGSEPGRSSAGKVTMAQCREIAEAKMADLSANDVDQAMKIILGSARSMGIEVKG